MMMFGFLILLLVLVFLVAGGIALAVWLNRDKGPAEPPVVAPAPAPQVPVEPREPAPAGQEKLFCTHCGAGLQKDWTHCPQCGAPVGS